MPDRPLAPWQTNAPGPYVTMPRERGTVSIWALGDERHRVLAEGGIRVDRVIVGRDEAHGLAHSLARRLGQRGVDTFPA